MFFFPPWHWCPKTTQGAGFSIWNQEKQAPSGRNKYECLDGLLENRNNTNYQNNNKINKKENNKKREA